MDMPSATSLINEILNEKSKGRRAERVKGRLLIDRIMESGQDKGVWNKTFNDKLKQESKRRKVMQER